MAQKRGTPGATAGAGGDRELEPPPARPPGQRRRTTAHRRRLGAGAGAGVAPENLVVDPEEPEHADGLPVLARGHRDLVAGLLQALDDRPQDEGMGRRRAIDPYAHRAEVRATP